MACCRIAACRSGGQIDTRRPVRPQDVSVLRDVQLMAHTSALLAEPRPFSGLGCSHKFKRAGVRHEVADPSVCSVQPGEIAFVNGPFTHGKRPGLKVFKSKQLSMLVSVKMVKGWWPQKPPLPTHSKSSPGRTPEPWLWHMPTTMSASTRSLSSGDAWPSQPFHHALWKHKHCLHIVSALLWQ